MIPDDCALVGFIGRTDLWWLRPLRPGFRHCFVAVRSGPFWVVIDPLSHHTQVHVETIAALADFYRDHGITVVKTRRFQAPHRAAPWRPYTCVEAVKRILGIRARGIFTPWQLYQWLTIKEKIP